MKTFGKILLTLIILGGLGFGGWYAYTRFFAEAPKEGTVYVQSVSAITGVGPAGRRSRYSGVVEAKNIIQVNPSNGLTVKECYVSAGDKVQKGTKLFIYDLDSMQIAFDQLQLDIQGLEIDVQNGNEKLDTLKTKLAKARENRKFEIQIDIQTQELELRKKEYELSNKRKEVDELEKALSNTVVYCPVAGTVRSVKASDSAGQDMGYGDAGQDNAYITIVAGNDYCVKGTVSEQTIHTLQEGMDVRIFSRIDDSVWAGRIYRINTEETKQQDNRYYYYDDGNTERASKYDFFVELDTNEGLLMGQHVYIEPGTGDETENRALLLPLYYVVDESDAPFVYAADEAGRIEKRSVTLGDRDEEAGTVAILEGLGYLDRIAFPDETVQVGMLASETSYVPEDLDSMMGGPMDGMDMPEGMTFPEGMDFPEGVDLPEGMDFEGADTAAPDQAAGDLPVDVTFVPEGEGDAPTDAGDGPEAPAGGPQG